MTWGPGKQNLEKRVGEGKRKAGPEGEMAEDWWSGD